MLRKLSLLLYLFFTRNRCKLHFIKYNNDTNTEKMLKFMKTSEFETSFSVEEVPTFTAEYRLF